MHRSTVQSAVLVLVATTVLSGCRDGDAAGGGDAVGGPPSLRDSAGVAITESGAPLWGEGEGWTVAAEPSVDIGVIDGALEYQLNQVSSATRLADGRILLADGGSSQLRMYDASGRHLWSAGRSGSGPGEFRSLDGMAVEGDSVVGLDAVLGRLTTFSLDGSLRGTSVVSPTGDPIHPLRMYFLAGAAGDGALLLVPRAYPADMRPQPTLLWDTIPNLLYGRDGALRDTVGEFSGMDLYSTPKISGDPFFGRFTSSTLHDEKLYITDGGRMEVRVYGMDGALQRIVRGRGEPPPVTDADMEALRAAYMARATDPARRAEMNRHLATWPRAETKPVISGLLVDDLGHLWAGDYRPYWDTREEPRRWTVFDPEGRMLGIVPLPAGFTPRHIGRDFVLGVWRDDVDVEHVRVFPLVRS